MKPLRRVAVLGAGTMGSRIAAHLANAGFPVDLLDIVIPNQAKRSQAALTGMESAARGKPAAFMSDSAKALITPGNFDDDLGRVAQCEWIIEAVAENLEIKRDLWYRVAALRQPGTILSTNTSGIPLAQIADGLRRANSAATSWARISSTRRATCTWPRSFPDRRRCPRCCDWVSDFVRPAPGQGRGAVQGHAQLHRQPDRLLLGREGGATHRRGRLHHRRSGLADRYR